jgi:predicted dienelactone hydrolase
MSIDTLAEYRPADAAFVIDRLIAGAEPSLAGRIDPGRIGACGHSFGGWTSLALNSIDRRPRATFAMAPLWGWRSPIAQLRRVGPRLRLDDWGRQVPTFVLAAELDNCVMLDDLRELADRLPAPVRFAVMPRAGHMHFLDRAEASHELMRSVWASPDFPDAENDGQALARSARPFSELMPEAHAHDTVKALCLAHMDAHLRGSAAAVAFLDADLEATFRARGIAHVAAAPRLLISTERPGLVARS